MRQNFANCALHIAPQNNYIFLKRGIKKKGVAPNKIMHLLIDPVPKTCQKKIHGAQSECGNTL